MDDGIGDTLVLIDKPNGIGNAEEPKAPKRVGITATGSTTLHSVLLLLISIGLSF